MSTLNIFENTSFLPYGMCYDGLTRELLKAELRDGTLHCSNDADKFMEHLLQECFSHYCYNVSIALHFLLLVIEKIFGIGYTMNNKLNVIHSIEIGFDEINLSERKVNHEYIRGNCIYVGGIIRR